MEGIILKTKKELALLALTVGASVALVACGGSEKPESSSAAGESTSEASSTETSDFSAVIITDQGGIDDKSFNQGAWEGLTDWGKENGKSKGVGGYDYLQSNSDSDYVTNLNTAVLSEFNMIYGIGYKLADAITEAANANPNNNFAIVDSVVDLPNVASINFRDHEASFLAGVAAGLTTKTNKIGFIGGMHGDVIDRFEAGFVAGVKAVKPDAEVSVQYADSFVDAAKGKSLASAMFASNIDIIFHAAGAVGTGLFSEAKEIVQADPSKEIWVIGVDQDQSNEGVVDASRNVTLTSTLKGVGTSVKKFTEEAQKGNFNGGKNIVYGLADDGVGLTDGQLTSEVIAKVNEYKQAIIDGKQEVPEKP